MGTCCKSYSKKKLYYQYVSIQKIDHTTDDEHKWT